MSEQTTPLNNGWAGRPGVPLNPEKRQWHWVCGHSPAEKPRPELWSRNVAGFFWWSSMMWREDAAALHWRYLRPCFMPDQEAELEEALRFYADKKSWRHTISLGHPQIDGMTSLAEKDRGKRARAALGEGADET
jgi:hypothetical protein